MKAFNLSSRIKQVYNKVFLGLRFAQQVQRGERGMRALKVCVR